MWLGRITYVVKIAPKQTFARPAAGAPLAKQLCCGVGVGHVALRSKIGRARRAPGAAGCGRTTDPDR
jgi:hypothetical protein